MTAPPSCPSTTLAELADTPRHFVIVGAGKTATDGIVWLLTNGVAARPDRVGPTP